VSFLVVFANDVQMKAKISGMMTIFMRITSEFMLEGYQNEGRERLAKKMRG
jgi:hypothetical protein